MNRSGLIYKLTFASGKSYIGLTTQPLKNRIKEHRFDALRRASPLPVHNAWRVHGEPEASVLAEATIDDLCDLEVRLIRENGTLRPGGYNLSLGGDMPPSWIPGVPEKISALAKARGISDAHRAAMRQGLLEAYKDPELRARLSEIRRGRPVTEEHKAKLRLAMVGRKLTEEHKAKLKLARNKRPPASDETRSRMSGSQKARRALQPLITQSEGGPSVAPESDKRPAMQVTSASASDFDDVTNLS